MVKFTTKKIDSLTLGERMKKIRAERRLSLAEISKSTRIQIKYLEYLEEGMYSKLPADVYVKGFLHSYATFMNLNENNLFKQYLREKGIHKNITKTDGSECHSNKPFNFSNFIITPKMIIVCTIIFLVVASFLYLYKEVNNFVSAPRLVIIKPMDGSATDSSSTHVTGVAEKDALVFINDQPVLVNEKGEFSEDVSLKEGLNMITVKARSKFNKEAATSVSVKANFQGAEQQQPESVPTIPNEQPASNGPIKAEVYVTPNPTWMSIEADGNLVYSGVLLPDSNQTFNANEKISITSGKGKETFVKINGVDMGTLSDEGGVVRDVLFDAKGRVTADKKN